MSLSFTKQNKLRFIRFAYWLGAILDLIWGVVALLNMFFSENQLFIDLGFPSSVTEFGYYTLVAVSGLMLGWTMILLWADRKPIERKDTLLMTVLVMILMMTTQMIGFLNSNPHITLISLLSNSTLIIYAIGYYLARELSLNIKNSPT